MSWVDLAAVISARAAMSATVVAALTYARTGGIHEKVDQVEVLVNHRLDVALSRIGQLGDALRAAGVDVPARPAEGEGPPGPRGAAGAEGPPGRRGPAGPPGSSPVTP
jgi:hypothetical protein